MSKAWEWPGGWQMPGPVRNLQMLRNSPGEGEGGGGAGRRWNCLMHKYGAFQFLSADWRVRPFTGNKKYRRTFTY